MGIIAPGSLNGENVAEGRRRAGEPGVQAEDDTAKKQPKPATIWGGNRGSGGGD